MQGSENHHRARRSTGLAALAAASLLLLPGCAAMVHDDWHPHPTHKPLPPYNVVVAAAELPKICGDYPGMQLHGCAVRDFGSNVCVIYTGPQPAAWLLEHERRHCAGWDHDMPHGTPVTRQAAVTR